MKRTLPLISSRPSRQPSRSRSSRRRRNRQRHKRRTRTPTTNWALILSNAKASPKAKSAGRSRCPVRPIRERSTRTGSTCRLSTTRQAPASLMIFQRRPGVHRTWRATVRAPNVLDNLIYRRELPVMLAVFINPGRTPEQPEPTPQELGQPGRRTGRRNTTRSTTSTHG